MPTSHSYTRRDVLKTLGVTLTGLVLPITSFAEEGGDDYSKRLIARVWAEKIAARHKLNLNWILETLSKARHVMTSKKTMDRSSTEKAAKPVKNWTNHKNLMVTEERIEKGARFMRTHAAALEKAQDLWEVPPLIITAIIGVETIYGKSLGRYRALDVLATLSFDHERRAEYFQSELEAFFVLCAKSQVNPLTVQSSFAGAIGMPQFMPSNILRYGFDLDGDGKINIRYSAADAIGSTAKFLKEAGWDSELPVEWPCRANGFHAADLNSGGIVANTTLQNLLDAGVEPLGCVKVKATTPALLIDLPYIDSDGKNSVHWYIGTVNFATLLKYNRSYFYAQSVYELSEAIEEKLNAPDPMLFF